MKKLIAILTLTAILMACNNSETQTETNADSARTDSMPVMDTTKKVIDEAKDLLDSAAKKMDTAAIKLKEGSDKIKK